MTHTSNRNVPRKNGETSPAKRRFGESSPANRRRRNVAAAKRRPSPKARLFADSMVSTQGGWGEEIVKGGVGCDVSPATFRRFLRFLYGFRRVFVRTFWCRTSLPWLTSHTPSHPLSPSIHNVHGKSNGYYRCRKNRQGGGGATFGRRRLAGDVSPILGGDLKVLWEYVVVLLLHVHMGLYL